MKLSYARRDNLLATTLDDEVVLYDTQRKQVHSLNRVAVAIWNHADGTKTIEELQRHVSEDLAARIDLAAVRNALHKLERAHLLVDKLGNSGRMTRREALRKAGRYSAAAVVATPIIASALVPVAAAAASVCVGAGSPGTTAGATCGAICQCLKTMTPSGPGSPACVDYTHPTFASCGPQPGGTYLPCAGTNNICVELDGSFNLGLCFPRCPTPTCTC